AHTALPDHLHSLHIGRVHREHALHAYAVRHAAHGEGLTDAAALAGNDSAFKLLDTLPVAFADVHVHPHGVADVELRHLSLHGVLRDHFDGVHLIFLQFHLVSDIHASKAADCPLLVHAANEAAMPRSPRASL